jgi:hypothetical protein
MPSQHASNHDDYLARYLKTGIKHMMGTEREVEACRKDGSIFPCTLELTEVEQGGDGGKVFCGFIRSLEKEKALEQRQSELENEVMELKQMAPTSKYGEAVDYIDTLIGRGADREAREKLVLVKTCLIQGNTAAMHVPESLSKADNDYNAYIMSEFAGVKGSKRKTFADVAHTAMTLKVAANSFLASLSRENRETRRRNRRSSIANYNDIIKASNNRDTVFIKAKEAAKCVLPEFLQLDIGEKNTLK